MIKLVWLVLIITMQGPQGVRPVGEERRFDTKEACAEFGAAMTPRMEDYARGMLSADWSVPMLVRFHCTVDGTPA